MSEESSEDLAKKLSLLEQQLAAITAERNLLHDQLGQAQEATLAAERRAAAAETELKIAREQNLARDGEVGADHGKASAQIEASPAPVSEQPPSSVPAPQPQLPPDPEVQPQSPPDTTSKEEPPVASASPPDTSSEGDSSRIAKIWRWLWEENNRNEDTG